MLLGSMILVIVLVASRLPNSTFSGELQALPKTFVCDEIGLLSTRLYPDTSLTSVSDLAIWHQSRTLLTVTAFIKTLGNIQTNGERP